MNGYILRSQFATVCGSKRTHVPMRKDGMRPAFACLKMVTLEIFRISQNAVKAWSCPPSSVVPTSSALVRPISHVLPCSSGVFLRVADRQSSASMLLVYHVCL